MEFSTHTSSPHLANTGSLDGMMRQVLYALIPGTLAAIWFFGWGVLINLVLACLFAVSLEALTLRLRNRPIKPFISDFSAILTAWLLALAMPQLAPWWLVFIGIFFAIVIAKHLYGGLGQNPFNPAMVGYVVLLISFPALMTGWMGPSQLLESPLGLMDSLAYVFSGNLPAGQSLDAYTMATPLDVVKTGLTQHQTISEIMSNPLFGDFSGKGWEWIANFYALGGIWLIYKKVIPWQTPVAVLLGLGIPAGILFLSNPDHFASPAFHIFSGGAILGAFFIATDPVSGCTTWRGRIAFGAGVGLLTFIIRTWGGFPDAIAFSVLLMNMAAPVIDHYTQPRVFGHQ